MDEEQTVTQEQPVQEEVASGGMAYVHEGGVVLHVQEGYTVQPSARAAIQAYQAWLSNQPRQIGPFGVFWNAEEGQALVKQYCEEQGWS